MFYIHPGITIIIGSLAMFISMVILGKLMIKDEEDDYSQM